MDKIVMTPVGKVVNEVANRKDTSWGDDISSIVLDEQYVSGLKGLEDFSHAIILFYLDKAEYIGKASSEKTPEQR